MSKQYRFECVIDLPWVAPTRLASSEEEFIENLLNEYNHALDGLVDIHRSDIRKGSIECYDELEEEEEDWCQACEDGTCSDLSPTEEEEDKPNIDDVTHAFDEMSTSDLCMWLEDNMEKDSIIERAYWDLDYVAKKWIKEKMGE